jgi:hypothetical protein
MYKLWQLPAVVQLQTFVKTTTPYTLGTTSWENDTSFVTPIIAAHTTIPCSGQSSFLPENDTQMYVPFDVLLGNSTDPE